MKAPISKYPHCGNDKVYFIKTQIYGSYEFKLNFDGTEEDGANSDMHHHLQYTYSKYAYCTKCRKRLFKHPLWIEKKWDSENMTEK